jgi:hypothetical protein
MTRAIARFTVCHGACRVRVRLLPTIKDVDAEYREGKRRRDGKWVHAFFTASRSPLSQHVGTIVLPFDGDLAECVPHEVAHAAMQHVGAATAEDDEAFATTVGLLTTRIFTRLRRLGMEV